MKGSRRGFLGALTALPALVGLGKRAVATEGFVGSTDLFERVPDPRQMRTIILRWADGKEERTTSRCLPLDAVVYAQRRAAPSWGVGLLSESEAFPTPQGPTFEKVTFRFTGQSLCEDVRTGVTIPIYEEVREHALHQRRSGMLVCRECGQEWPPGVSASGECYPGPAWNVRKHV